MLTIETMVTLALGIGVGVAATVTMDVLGSVARKAGLTAGAKGTWVGRWYLGIPRGKLAHSDIRTVPEQRGEKHAALVGHYLIGIALAVFYVVGASWLGVSPGGFLVAVGYGLVTCVFPLLLVYPALGFGPFGRRAPPELKPLTSSFVNHFLYGVGLWWSSQLFLSIG